MDNLAKYPTQLGTRIHEFLHTPSFGSEPNADISISTRFFGIDETFVHMKKDKLTDDETFSFPPRESAPDSPKWDDRCWAEYLADFAAQHQGLLPNFITVKFAAGSGNLRRDFDLYFDPMGHLLYAELRTSVGAWGSTSYRGRIFETHEALLTSLGAIESYLKVH